MTFKTGIWGHWEGQTTLYTITWNKRRNAMIMSIKQNWSMLLNSYEDVGASMSRLWRTSCKEDQLMLLYKKYKCSNTKCMSAICKRHSGFEGSFLSLNISDSYTCVIYVCNSFTRTSTWLQEMRLKEQSTSTSLRTEPVTFSFCQRSGGKK